MPSNLPPRRFYPIDMTYNKIKLYVMKTKLTLRMEASVVAKAKRIARERNQSVTALFSEYITGQPELADKLSLAPATRSMVGTLATGGNELSQADYLDYIEKKHR